MFWDPAIRFIEDVWDDVKNFPSDVVSYVEHPDQLVPKLVWMAKFVGNIWLGEMIGGLNGATLLALADVLGFSTVDQIYNYLSRAWPRARTGPEKMLIDSVFLGTVPTNRLRIIGFRGAGDRPFTIPGTMIQSATAFIPEVNGMLEVAEIMAQIIDKYVMFLGEDGKNDAINCGQDGNYPPGAVLIHESTHAWQGHNQGWHWLYVFDSLAYQCVCCAKGGSAYDYTPGDQWRHYHAEAQARIVEDWFKSGMKPASQLYRYIAFNIRPGKPYAQSFPTKIRSDGSVTLAIEATPPGVTLPHGFVPPEFGDTDPNTNHGLIHFGPGGGSKESTGGKLHVRRY